MTLTSFFSSCVICCLFLILILFFALYVTSHWSLLTACLESKVFFVYITFPSVTWMKKKKKSRIQFPSPFLLPFLPFLITLENCCSLISVFNLRDFFTAQWNVCDIEWIRNKQEKMNCLWSWTPWHEIYLNGAIAGRFFALACFFGALH